MTSRSGPAAACAACGSNDLVRHVKLMKAGVYGGELRLESPVAGEMGGVRAVACASCGYVQLQATDLVTLRGALEKSRVGLKLGE